MTRSLAQWTGSGAGGSGTDFNDTANWTSGTINGNFTGDTTAATVSLSAATTALTDLNFNWTSGATSLTLVGNGTGANEIISLGGNILLSRAGTMSTVTIGSDVTLDLGTGFTTTHNIQYGSTGTGTTSLIINGLITGTAGTGGALSLTYNTANPTVYLTNDGNTFDAPVKTAGFLYFTSISNVGGGASALGAASTVANGTITVSNGGALLYNGTTNQSSDRNINLTMITNGAAGVQNASTVATKLVLSGTVQLSGTTPNADFQVLNSGSVLELSGQIKEGASTTNVRINNTAGNVGTVRLSGTNNTYKGVTSIGRGVLEVTKLADGGQNSSIGAASNAASNLVISGANSAVFRYVGSSNSSTDRLFTIANGTTNTPTIDASGDGTVSFTNTGAVAYSGTANAAVNFILTGTNSGANRMTPSIANNGTGVVSLNKSGVGKWVLAGANTYTGTTTVSAGTLAIDGTSTGSAFTVKSGATLGGTGTISPGDSHALQVQSGGTLAPGEDGAVGTLTVALGGTGDTASFLSGATFTFELAAPGISDMLTFTGLSAATDITFNNNVINFLNLGGLAQGTYTLMTFDGTHDYTGTLQIGTGLEAFSGSYLSYNDNSIVLNVVPEPNAWMLLMLGGVVLAMQPMRKRRALQAAH